MRRNFLTCSERRRSMLRASMARPRNSSTSSSGFRFSCVFLKMKCLDNTGGDDNAGFPLHKRGGQTDRQTDKRLERHSPNAHAPAPLPNTLHLTGQTQAHTVGGGGTLKGGAGSFQPANQHFRIAFPITTENSSAAGLNQHLLTNRFSYQTLRHTADITAQFQS